VRQVPARETLECKTPASLSWLHEPSVSSKRVTPFPIRSMACGQLWGCNAAAHRMDAPSTASSGAGCEFAGTPAAPCVRPDPRPPASAPLPSLTRTSLVRSVRARQSRAAEPGGRSSTITRGHPLGRVRIYLPECACLRRLAWSHSLLDGCCAPCIHASTFCCFKCSFCGCNIGPEVTAYLSLMCCRARYRGVGTDRSQVPQFKRTEADTGSPEVQIAQVRRACFQTPLAS